MTYPLDARVRTGHAYGGGYVHELWLRLPSDGHTQLGPVTAYAPSPGMSGRAGTLGLVRDCADVAGFDVAAPLPCFPCDSITAVNPSPS